MVCGSPSFDGESLSAMLHAITSSTPIRPNQIATVKNPRARIAVPQMLARAARGRRAESDESAGNPVLGEMRAIGDETGGLMQDLKNYFLTERTAADRMSRRRLIVDEIHALRTGKVKQSAPTVPEPEELPVLAV
jgi:hypothetical protein